LFLLFLTVSEVNSATYANAWFPSAGSPRNLVAFFYHF